MRKSLQWNKKITAFKTNEGWFPTKICTVVDGVGVGRVGQGARSPECQTVII